MIGDRQKFFYKVTYPAYKTVKGVTSYGTEEFHIKTEIPEDQMTTELANIIVRNVADFSALKAGSKIDPGDRPIAVELDEESLSFVFDIFHKIRTVLNYQGREYVYYMDPRRFENDTLDVALVQADYDKDRGADDNDDFNTNNSPSIVIVTVPRFVAEHDTNGSNVKALLQQLVQDFIDFTTIDVRTARDGRLVTTEQIIPASYEKARKEMFPRFPSDVRPNTDLIDWKTILLLPQSFLDTYCIKIRPLNIAWAMPVHLGDSAFLCEHKLTSRFSEGNGDVS